MFLIPYTDAPAVTIHSNEFKWPYTPLKMLITIFRRELQGAADPPEKIPYTSRATHTPS